MLNILAQELNDILKGTSAEQLFSDFGKRIYFPNGIIAQSGEAKKLGSVANGTIGMTVINGKPAMLDAIHNLVPSLSTSELVAYAPTAGNAELREHWKNQILSKNPLLKNKSFSLPVVVPGLTAGISYTADLFLDETKTLLAPEPSWDNYSLITEARRGAEFKTFNLFKNKGFDIESFENAVKQEAQSGSVRVILNFPQNPSGYSPTHNEVIKICEILKGVAEQGAKVLAISDDAYFGLNYEENIESQSLFAYTADLHKNILAIKIDGPTKEDFVWGFRSGFLTFASKDMTEEQYNALVKKLMGTIRSSVSCAATPSQSLILKAVADPQIENQKQDLQKILEARYKAVRKFVDTHTSSVLEALPFNSGYFMSFKVKGKNAEVLRKKILNDYGIGTVSIDAKTLRVAFSSIDEEKIETVYSTIYKAAEEL